jgi:hypothetical protein
MDLYVCSGGEIAVARLASIATIHAIQEALRAEVGKGRKQIEWDEVFIPSLFLLSRSRFLVHVRMCLFFFLII